MSRVWQHVKLSDVSLGNLPQHSLVAEEDVKKPNKQTNDPSSLSAHLSFVLHPVHLLVHSASFLTVSSSCIFLQLFHWSQDVPVYFFLFLDPKRLLGVNVFYSWVMVLSLLPFITFYWFLYHLWDSYQSSKKKHTFLMPPVSKKLPKPYIHTLVGFDKAL